MIPILQQSRFQSPRHLLARPAVLALIAPLALLGTAPVAARAPASQAQLQAQSQAQSQAGASALPPLPDQSAPWLYRGADVPQDREWKFGALPNGLRWAVRKNGVPPGQVSIRIRMDVGSLYERQQEAGFAHLLEHSVFRESRYLGQGQAIPTWQRLGATFGTDTNAQTTPTQTVFEIDLPDATPATLDESFRLLSGMMIAPTLSEADIRTDAPIVLAEKREHGGAAERVQDATREVIFAGQPLADHSTIGPVESIEGAHEAAVKAFHARWYRPENAAIIVAGDADPRLLAALIGKWFGDWPVVGPHTPTPDFGKPLPVAGADPANPVGPARVLVVPGMPRSITWTVERPWHEKNDTIVYNQGKMIDQLALAIINRRLEARARAGGAFLGAQVGQQDESRSVDATFVNITPLDGDWRGAIRDTRAVIADALARPPSPEEIAREAAEMNIAYVSMVEQRALQPGARLADDLVEALDIHETVTSPEGMLQVFHGTVPLCTPQAVLEHSRHVFSGSAIRAVYVTPEAKEADDAALAKALQESVSADPAARLANRQLSFADLPPIGAPGPQPKAQPTGLLEIERVDLGNGVQALLWPTQDDPGRVAVKVRFGAGYRAFKAGDAAYVALGNLALVSSGEGKLGQEELDRITTGRKMGFEFHIEDGAFSFSADTRSEDLADQLYLFADKFAQPRWDAGPLVRARALARAQYDSYAASPQGVLSRDLRFLQHGGDQRYATATPAELAAVTPEGFHHLWEPLLQNGPIEVEVYGDVGRAQALDALRRSFGALAPRPPLPDGLAPTSRAFAALTTQPVVLRHQGDANQAAAVVSWPTGGGIGGVHESRQLEVLAQIFSNRLLDAMREKAGASYAPQVVSDWPVDLSSGGTITALAQLQPEMAGQFFTTADRIAAELASQPPAADELARVIGPLREQISRAATASAFFMWQIEGATQEPARIAAVPSILQDYTEVSPEAIRLLAARYLVPGKEWRLAVMPQAWAQRVSAGAPASAPSPATPNR